MRYFYDLHIHSCLSPCGDDDMTPNNIVNMAKIKGLDVIAITDHNCAKNAAAVMQCGSAIGVLVIPGMEVECAEEFHLLTLFRNLESCLAMEKIVFDALPQIQNDVDIFGEQIIMDSSDQLVGGVGQMLVAPCSMSVDEIVAKTSELGGVCVPAHVDKSAYSIISNLGYIPKELGFNTIELSKRADRDAVLSEYTYRRDYKVIVSSDAHYLHDISEQEHFMDLSELSADKVIDCLMKG